MDSLKIAENNFGLRIYCTACKKQYNHDNIDMCKHPEKQRYKSIIYSNDGSRKVKLYQTNDWENALIQAIQFKKHIKLNRVQKIENFNETQNIELSVIDAANTFLTFKHDIGVQPHQVRNLSKDYLDSIKLYIGQFIDAINNAGYDGHSLPISRINEIHVGIWYKEITARYAKGSWNAPLRVLRLWIEHIINKQCVKMYNPFKDVRLVQVENNVEAITKNEFQAACDAVNNKSPWAYLGGKTTERKNRYRPYLIDAFKLALFTGLRREEFLSLTWQDIHFVNDEFGYMIITDNLKVERMTGMKYKKKYIPIGPQLETVLHSLGWGELKESELFIIEPMRNISIQTLMDNCTKGFSHYFKQAHPHKPAKQLKVLRKTYLTYLAMEVGEDTVKFSSHSNTKVLEDHYFDKRLLAKGFGMKIFI